MDPVGSIVRTPTRSGYFRSEEWVYLKRNRRTAENGPSGHANGLAQDGEGVEAPC